MKIAICDDEIYWNDILKATIMKWAEANNMEMQCSSFFSPKELLDSFVASGGYDAIFLDILFGEEGPDGMNTARQLREMGRDVPIIFVTIDRMRAVDGYLVEAMGFLCKPFEEKRLFLFLDRIQAQSKKEKIITILSGTEIINIQPHDIIYVEVMDHMIYYHTRGRKINSRGTLSETIEKLGRDHFIRIHRSYIISKSKIYRIKTTFPYFVELRNGTEVVTVPVSRNYIDKLLEVYSDAVLERMI